MQLSQLTYQPVGTLILFYSELSDKTSFNLQNDYKKNPLVVHTKGSFFKFDELLCLMRVLLK
jgi:hypothetical protein